MQIKPDFKGKEELLEYMVADSENIERSFGAAGSLLDHIDSRIGGKNYWQLSYTEMCWLYAAIENQVLSACSHHATMVHEFIYYCVVIRS